MKGYQNRRTGKRLPYKVLVLVCEGEKTERIYFNRFRKRGCGLKIETPNSRVTDPVNLVKFANRQIRKFDLDFDNGDEIWCIFDADNTTNDHINKALKLADRNLKIALSNPSFEIWYLLHFEAYRNPIDSKQVLSKLKKHLFEYSKSEDIFDDISEKVQTAIKNAKDLNSIHERKGTPLNSIDSNPSTQVFKIVEDILETIECKT